jgi:hypothetical protein
MFLYSTSMLKILFFLNNNSKKNKSPSAKAKRLGIVWLPLLERFGTFCWGEIIEELQNTHKLEELIGIPISTTNNV